MKALSRALVNFHLVLMTGVVALLSKILSTYSDYHILPLDRYMTYCFLFFLVAFGSLLVALLLAAAESILDAIPRTAIRNLAPTVPHLVPFVMLSTALLNGLRLLLGSFGVDVYSVPTSRFLFVAALASLTLFLGFRSALTTWLTELYGRARFLNIPFLLAAVVGIGYCIYGNIVVNAPPRKPALGHQYPNVILLELDSLTAEDMSLYGYHLPTTPNLQKWAEESTVYDWAFANSDKTEGATVAMLTGRLPYFYPFAHVIGDAVTRERGFTILPKILRQYGYSTMKLTWTQLPDEMHIGHFFDTMPWESRIPWPIHLLRRLTDRTRIQVVFWLNMALWEEGGVRPAWETYWSPEHQFALAESMISQNPRGKPFFLWFHLHPPHYPYDGHQFAGTLLPLEEGLADSETQKPYWGKHFQPGEQPTYDKLRLRYDEAIMFTDWLIQDFVNFLKEIEVYDDTMIIVTSDHGQNFSHGWHSHGLPIMVLSSVRIPMIVHYPGQTEGQRVAGPAQQVDILPTVLEAAGIPQHPWVDGRSLLSLGETDRPTAWIVGKHMYNEFLGIVSEGRYVYTHSETVTLQDLHTDPEGKYNVGAEEIDRLLMLQGMVDQLSRRLEYVATARSALGAPALPRAPSGIVENPRRYELASEMVSTSDFTWLRADTGQSVETSNGRLQFRGPTMRTYSSFPLPRNTALLMITFSMDEPSARKSVAVAADFHDDTGSWIDRRAATAHASLATTQRRLLLLPVPDGASWVVLALQNADDNSRVTVQDLEIGFVADIDAGALGSCVDLRSEESDSQLGPGWYGIEEDGEHRWRWMAGEGGLILGPERGHSTLEIAGHAVTDPFPSPDVTLEIFVEDRSLGAARLGDGDFFLQFEVPDALLQDELVRVRLTPSRTFVPEGESRDLSVIISSVCLR
jgi:arylsulfatase